jgi:hypothetical protein
MFQRVKYTIKFFFTNPKPKIEETEYKSEKKSFKIDYDKYYTKKEKFTLLMWSFELMILAGESMYINLFLFGDLMRFAFLGALIFFYLINMKNVSRIRGKYKERAIEEGQYGR